MGGGSLTSWDVEHEDLAAEFSAWRGIGRPLFYGGDDGGVRLRSGGAGLGDSGVQELQQPGGVRAALGQWLSVGKRSQWERPDVFQQRGGQ